MGKEDLEANHCVPIKGECHKNPCHPDMQIVLIILLMMEHI